MSFFEVTKKIKEKNCTFFWIVGWWWRKQNEMMAWTVVVVVVAGSGFGVDVVEWDVFDLWVQSEE